MAQQPKPEVERIAPAEASLTARSLLARIIFTHVAGVGRFRQQGTLAPTMSRTLMELLVGRGGARGMAANLLRESVTLGRLIFGRPTAVAT